MKNNEKMKTFGLSLKILDDFHDFVSECVSFPEKINNQFLRGSQFFLRKVTMFTGRETKTHILPKKINDNNSPRVSTSNNNYSLRKINHSTTNNNITKAFDSNTRFLVCVTVMFQNPADGFCADRVNVGSARRRRERRLRSFSATTSG